MTIKHINEKWYVINTDQTDGKRPSWQERSVSLHGPNSEARVAWSIFGHGFGFGFRIGRNGGESDVGLDVYLGKLASVWMRLRSPWTKWANIPKERDEKHWYKARHYGIRFFSRRDCFIEGEIGARAHEWSRSDPWWMQWSLTTTTLLGRTRGETVEGASGVAMVPLPEGNYLATWTERTYINRYVRFPGTLLDRIKGPRQHSSVDLNIDGGIPHEGKGENSWDCGMDGLFGCSGRTLEDAIGNAVRHTLRDRERYGPRKPLPRPMTVTEAEEWTKTA